VPNGGGMTSGRERPLQLADQFRNGNLSSVAAEVACDGPTALAVAAILDAGELARLRRAVEAHLDRQMVVGGEARGGPVEFGRAQRWSF